MEPIKKELFDKTEDQLKKYFSKDKIIKSLQDRIFILDRQIESINRDLRDCNVSIEIESSSPSFEQKVQTSSNGTSYAEREVMRVTEIRIRRIEDKKVEKEKVLEKLDNIEIECNEIEWKIKDFTGELKTLLELSYKDKCNEYMVSQKMNLSQSQVNKRKKQMIQKIIMWEGWNNIGIKEE